MEKNYPSSTKVVVIGGGVIGCSVAYHLTKFGWKDVVLLERDQLTSGTTWHAAGLVSQLGPTAAVTKIRKYTLDLYKKLEKEVDHSAGLRINGALSIAQTGGRWQELQRQATTAQLYDVDIQILDKDQMKKNYPMMHTEDLKGGVLMPGDGAADPSGVTHMLAKGARQGGAKIFEQSPVEKILTKNGRVHGVRVNGKDIECEYVVLATGMWSRQIGEKMGVSIPLYPAEHFYVITEPIENLSPTLPVIRDFDSSVYVKEDAGKLLIGDLGGKSVMAMQGRFHYYEGYSMNQIVFPIRVAKMLGIQTLLVSNACGGLNPNYERGDIMLINDHINFLGDNPLIGPNDPNLGPRFPDMSQPYTERLLSTAEQVALDAGIKMHQGVYLAVSGPMLETKAEYRYMRQLGADVVGMSTVPEVIAAVHMSMEVLGISVITDECFPDSLEPVSLDDVLEAAAMAEPHLTRIVVGVLERL